MWGQLHVMHSKRGDDKANRKHNPLVVSPAANMTTSLRNIAKVRHPSLRGSTHNFRLATMSRLLEGIRRKLALALWPGFVLDDYIPDNDHKYSATACAKQESIDYPSNYTRRENQNPNCTPFPSRIINVNISGEQRPAILFNKGFIETMIAGSHGDATCREDWNLIAINWNALCDMRLFFEQEDDRLSSMKKPLSRENAHGAELENARRAQTNIRRKLTELDEDEEELKGNRDFVSYEAIQHLKKVMSHIRPLLETAGLVSMHQQPLGLEEIALRYKVRYHEASGGDASSKSTDSRRHSDTEKAPTGLAAQRRIDHITAMKLAFSEQREGTVTSSKSGSQWFDARSQTYEEEHYRGAEYLERMNKQHRDRERLCLSSSSVGHSTTRSISPNQKNRNFSDRAERLQNLQNRSGKTVSTPRDLAERAFRAQREELDNAELAFASKTELRDQEVADLRRRLAAGTANSHDVEAFQLSDFTRVQTLTRRLIEAEARFRKAKAECQELGADILDDGISSIFPSNLSGDDSAMTEGIPTADDKTRIAPKILRWRDTLPNVVDTLLAG